MLVSILASTRAAATKRCLDVEKQAFERLDMRWGWLIFVYGISAQGLNKDSMLFPSHYSSCLLTRLYLSMLLRCGVILTPQYTLGRVCSLARSSAVTADLFTKYFGPNRTRPFADVDQSRGVMHALSTRSPPSARFGLCRLQ